MYNPLYIVFLFCFYFFHSMAFNRVPSCNTAISFKLSTPWTIVSRPLMSTLKLWTTVQKSASTSWSTLKIHMEMVCTSLFLFCYLATFHCLLYCFPLFIILLSIVYYITFHCLLYYFPLFFIILLSIVYYITFHYCLLYCFHCLLYCFPLFIMLLSIVYYIAFCIQSS